MLELLSRCGGADDLFTALIEEALALVDDGLGPAQIVQHTTQHGVDHAACGPARVVLGPLDGFVDRGERGHAPHEQNLCRSAEQGRPGLIGGFLPVATEVALDKPAEGDPATNNDVVEGVCEGGVPLAQRFFARSRDGQVRVLAHLASDDGQHTLAGRVAVAGADAVAIACIA